MTVPMIYGTLLIRLLAGCVDDSFQWSLLQQNVWLVTIRRVIVHCGSISKSACSLLLSWQVSIVGCAWMSFQDCALFVTQKV